MINRIFFSCLVFSLLMFGCSMDFSHSVEKENGSISEVENMNQRSSDWITFEDVTGDGVRDKIRIYGFTCYLYIGYYGGVYIYHGMSSGQYFSYPYKAFYDVNADGYKDFIGIAGTHAYVVPGGDFLGKEFFNHENRRYMNEIYFDYPQKYIYDATGDGYLDYVGISGPHRYIVPGNSDCYFDSNKRIYTKLW